MHPCFEGCTKELCGHIYDYGMARQAGMWTTTTKQIGEYVYRTLKYGSDTMTAIQNILNLYLKSPLNQNPFQQPSQRRNQFAQFATMSASRI